MKVLQLIDSLEAGGAERVAVNFANGLVSEVEGSFLCATRAEGLLKESLKKDVDYVFLKKSSTLDIKAIRSLYLFIKKNQIDIIHAHASSFFLASIMKFLNPKLKLVWHDHYGKSEFLNNRPKHVLKFCSCFFNHVFSVNSILESWSRDTLKVKSVSYLPNYAVKDDTELITKLKGKLGKRIVCLANLRPQKDHLNLLEAFNEVVRVCPDWSLHLVGQDFEDAYSETIFDFIRNNNFEDNVFVYGSCTDVSAILKDCAIGVLPSKSEGLPLALLEYGLAGLPVICTNVGDCKLVVSDASEGQLIPSENSLELKKAILQYITDTEKAKLAGIHLKQKVEQQFAEDSVLKKVTTIYQSI